MAKTPGPCNKCGTVFSGKACKACAHAKYRQAKDAMEKAGGITVGILTEHLFICSSSPSGLRSRKAGEIAGSKTPRGYWRVYVAGVYVAAHRAVFALAHGQMPTQQLDHINGDRGDNTPENLREVVPAQNSRNAKRQERNTSGKTGVDKFTFNNYDYWRARWYSAEGKLTNKQFSIKKLGDEGAYAAACAYRDAMTAAVGGYTARHGTKV